MLVVSLWGYKGRILRNETLVCACLGAKRVYRLRVTRLSQSAFSDWLTLLRNIFIFNAKGSFLTASIYGLSAALKELRHDILSRFFAKCKITFSARETTKY